METLRCRLGSDVLAFFRRRERAQKKDEEEDRGDSFVPRSEKGQGNEVGEDADVKRGFSRNPRTTAASEYVSIGFPCAAW